MCACHMSHPTLPLSPAGHLSGILPEVGERALLVAFTALVLVFAARKYTQPIKDDVGDKSVFTCAPPCFICVVGYP